MIICRLCRKFAVILSLLIALPFTTGQIARSEEGTGSQTNQVILQAAPQKPDNWPKSPEARQKIMQTTRNVIEQRIHAILMSSSQFSVEIMGDDKLLVKLPDVPNQSKLIKSITSTAPMELYWLKNVQTPNNRKRKWLLEMTGGEVKSYTFIGPKGVTINSSKQPQEVLQKVVDAKHNKPILTGKDIRPNTKAVYDQQNGVVVNIEFTSQGASTFRRFTREHVGEILAIFYDEKLLTAPVILDTIPNGKAQITGFMSLEQGTQVANFLNAGVLPVPLKVVAQEKNE